MSLEPVKITPPIDFDCIPPSPKFLHPINFVVQSVASAKRKDMLRGFWHLVYRYSFYIQKPTCQSC